jgi:glycosyltransferase involved in cell wall biosynthesis
MHQNIEDILQLKNRLIPNVKYVFLPERKNGYFSQLQEVKSIVKKYDIQHVVLLYFNSFFVSLAVGSFDFTVSGIVFNTYNPNYEKYSFLKRISKEIYYALVCRRKNIKKLFVLNDKKSCEWLNRHFHTKKFCYLPDPVPTFQKEDLPQEIANLQKDRKIALHFGALSERKGTLLILDAIEILPSEIQKKISLFLVGKPCTKAFGELLKTRIEQIRQQYPAIYIIYIPDFVTVGQMESYFELADFVLMPYLSNNLSSGVLGHAAKHNKPVITGKGLLGEIVEEYGLGISIEPIVENLGLAIQDILLDIKLINGILYVENHSFEIFAKTLMA